MLSRKAGFQYIKPTQIVGKFKTKKCIASRNLDLHRFCFSLHSSDEEENHRKMRRASDMGEDAGANASADADANASADED